MRVYNTDLLPLCSTLVAEPYPEECVAFMKENGIQHVQIGMPGNKAQDASNIDRTSIPYLSCEKLC